MDAPAEGNISNLTHVKPRADIQAAEDVANRAPCKDFGKFKPLFETIRNDLDTGKRETRPFGKDAGIEKGEFFILSGQMAYVAEAGKEERRTKPEPLPQAHDRYLRIIANLRAGASLSKTDGLEKFVPNETLHELISAIERDIEANKPEAALDRLHTYCMKKFAHLLSLRGEDSSPNESLNSRAARYFNPIRKAGGMRPISEKIVKSTVDIFELFNGIRNNASFAHDSQLVDSHEARFIFEAIINLLRFAKSVEGKNFE